MPQVTKDFISSKASSVGNLVILGGTGAVSDNTVQKVETLLSTPTVTTTTPSAITIN